MEVDRYLKRYRKVSLEEAVARRDALDLVIAEKKNVLQQVKTEMPGSEIEQRGIDLFVQRFEMKGDLMKNLGLSSHEASNRLPPMTDAEKKIYAAFDELTARRKGTIRAADAGCGAGGVHLIASNLRAI